VVRRLGEQLPFHRNANIVTRNVTEAAVVKSVPVVPAVAGQASERLFEMAYDELRRIARLQRRRVGHSHTLNTTALVHEAYLKLSHGAHAAEFEREHFLALTARAMRQILIDHARSRVCLKRGGDIEFTEANE